MKMKYCIFLLVNFIIKKTKIILKYLNAENQKITIFKIVNPAPVLCFHCTYFSLRKKKEKQTKRIINFK